MRLRLFCIKCGICNVIVVLIGMLLSACTYTNQLAPNKPKSVIEQTPQFACISIADQTKRNIEISHRISWLPTVRKHLGSKIKFAVDGQLNKYCELTELKMVQSTGNIELDESIMKELQEVRLPTQDSNKEIESFKLRFRESP